MYSVGLNPDQLMFDQRIDAAKIAVGGFSFGGLATYLAAYAPEYKDSQ